MKNEPLAKKILDIVETGFIRYKANNNACVLVISPVIGLKKVVYLINGQLRTPKIHQLYKLIDWLNKNHSTNINKKSLAKGFLANSSWLSGFVDADGSFSVQYSKTENGAKKRKVSCRLRIEQTMQDPVSGDSSFNVLNEIALFLNCRLLTRIQKSTNNEYYTLAASSRVSISTIVDYFSRFSLFSSKYLDYKDWEKIVLLMLDNKHYTDKGLSQVESVRSRINTQRTHFDWQHLDKLFC